VVHPGDAWLRDRPHDGRREFLRLAAAAGTAGLVGWPLSSLAGEDPGTRARFWIGTDGKPAECRTCHPAMLPSTAAPRHAHRPVRCQLCARQCTLQDGERGLCRARVNRGGELRSLVHGRPAAIHLDPIEKKPFYHVLPGRSALSFGTAGCPLRCRFCQNWQLSQARPEDLDAPPRSASQMVDAAVARQAAAIAFTYNEPTVFVEYLLEVAAAARKAGRRSLLVSCGYAAEAPLLEMCQALDAIKIDLKGFSADFYRQVCGAELAPVLRSLRQVAKSRVHLEIVNLVVPTLNDAPDKLRDLSAFVAGELGPDVPLHFTRFHPDYQMTELPPTPVATLERARDLARDAGLRFVYVGNVPGHPGNHTYCPGCGSVVVERDGFLLAALHLKDGACAGCGRAIPGIWS
jgi:pyruvate formate lyase activating enzyme